jgi:hypothetical protein
MVATTLAMTIPVAQTHLSVEVRRSHIPQGGYALEEPLTHQKISDCRIAELIQSNFFLKLGIRHDLLLLIGHTRTWGLAKPGLPHCLTIVLTCGVHLTSLTFLFVSFIVTFSPICVHS